MRDNDNAGNKERCMRRSASGLIGKKKCSLMSKLGCGPRHEQVAFLGIASNNVFPLSIPASITSFFIVLRDLLIVYPRRARRRVGALEQSQHMHVSEVAGSRSPAFILERVFRCRRLLTTTPFIRSLGRMILVMIRYAFD